jgi:hypothetical protein
VALSKIACDVGLAVVNRRLALARDIVQWPEVHSWITRRTIHLYCCCPARVVVSIRWKQTLCRLGGSGQRSAVKTRSLNCEGRAGQSNRTVCRLGFPGQMISMSDAPCTSRLRTMMLTAIGSDTGTRNSRAVAPTPRRRILVSSAFLSDLNYPRSQLPAFLSHRLLF